LRLNFQASPARIARLDAEPGFQRLAESKKKDPKQRAAEEAESREEQERIRALLAGLPATLHKRCETFLEELTAAADETNAKRPVAIVKAILSALSERDETAEICKDEKGHPEPDPELRDTESVPLDAAADPADEDGVLDSVRAFFEREVAPHVPDAWINVAVRDHRDKLVGKVGYEISFTRYFYKYTPPRPLDEIEADIRVLEKEILEMLRDVTGGTQT